MTVRSIREVSSSKVLVTMEEDLSFPVYKKELKTYHLQEGEEVPPALWKELWEEVLPKRARLRAMHLLEKTDRTEKSLRRKLTESGYTEDLLENAVEYVKSFHYIDDVRFAFHYMDARKETHHPRTLEAELRERGVSSEDIRRAMDQVEFPDAREQISYWLAKKNYCSETADEKEKQRMAGFLMRKGFASSDIYRELF